MRFKSYAAALEWLESHVDFERVAPNRQRVPTLQPVRDVLAQLGDPHHDYPSIHVTGTNGKGTTTTVASELLRNTGLRVGTFTSPDLHRINERIALNGVPIDDEVLTGLLGRLSDVETASATVLTRFELLTVAALLFFSDEGVDVAVVEVGMGGTWDSTNVIDSRVAVLTNVDLDHTQVLGATVGAIARDKVGIFRADGAAVLGTTNPEVVEIAGGAAERLGCPLYRLDQEFIIEENDLALGGRSLRLVTPFGRYDDVLVSLHGMHQGVNASTAVVAVELFLGRALGESVVSETLAHVAMPGRSEILARHPMIVVDGAHNPAGVRALVATLDGAFDVAGVRRAVVGLLSGRELEDMVAPLVSAGFREFHCCPPNSPRAVPVEELVSVLRRLDAVAYAHPNARSALAHAREMSSEDDLIVVTGSLYLVGEVRGLILKVENQHSP